MDLHADANGARLVHEKIIGLNKQQKQALKKFSVCYVHDTFLFMPIKTWSYLLGEKYYNRDKIRQSIINIKHKYAAKLAKATSEKAKKKLILCRDKLIAKKQYQLQNGNIFMQIGSKPVYYTPNLVDENRRIFLNYMHSIGYLDAEIESKSEFLRKKVCITYKINPHNVYRISSHQLNIQDATIRDILLKYDKESFIKVNDIFQSQNCQNERMRIVTLLANNGYFQFNEQSIHFEAEVDKEKATIAVTTVVNQPGDGQNYHQMHISDVMMCLCSQEELQEKNTSLFRERYRGISFILSSKKFPLTDLVHKIAIRTGDLYDSSKISETYERLYQVNLFESVNILPKVESGKLIVYIYAKPYKPLTCQIEVSGEFLNLDLFKLCPIIKVTPTIRRFCGSIVSISAEWDFYWKFKHYESMYKYIDSNLDIKLFIPRYLLYLPYRIHERIAKFKPCTTFRMKYGVLDDPRHNSQKIDALLEYCFQSPQKNMSCSLFPIRMVYISPINKQIHPNNALLQYYFYTAIGVSVMFKRLSTQNWLNYKWMIAMDLDGGGVYEYLFQSYKMVPKGIALPRYFKIDLSYQRVFTINHDTVMVSHTKFGLFFPEDKCIVDIEKQYQAGGHGYVRAWDVNMLGPGCYCAKDLKQSCKGDLLLLSNIELRRKLIGYFESAMFLDIGNTWKLSKAPCPEMQFHLKNFYQLFALAGGCGLRFNFNQIFVICVDLAFKLRHPSGQFLPWSERWVLNFNIGYPF